MVVLGLSALYHDAAASIVIDGEIVAAAQEERFTRIKHDWHMPVNAIQYCLREAGIDKDCIDIVAFYDNPLYTLDRFVKNVAAAGNDGEDVIRRSFDLMFSDKLWVHKAVENVLGGGGRKFA